MDSKEKLSKIFNVSDYEAALYLAAQGGALTISELSERSHIPRTAVYSPLKALISKGFISPLVQTKKRKKYQAVEPQHLKHLFSRQLIDLNELVEQLGETISKTSGEIVIRYFEGSEGLQLASDIFLQESKTKLWKTFENPVTMERLVGAKQFEKYMHARVKKGIFCRTIIPAKEHTLWVKDILEKKKEYLLDIKLVSSDEYPLQASVAIGGQWILLVVGKEKPFAILIKNELLATTFETIHTMVWDRFS